MSHVRAEVLRVSRSRTGWRDTGGGGGNNSGTISSTTTTTMATTTNPGQIQYINSLKSTYEGGVGGGSGVTTTNGGDNDKIQRHQPWHQIDDLAKSPVVEQPLPTSSSSSSSSNSMRPPHQRHVIGSKVSTIANMFQSLAPQSTPSTPSGAGPAIGAVQQPNVSSSSSNSSGGRSCFNVKLDLSHGNNNINGNSNNNNNNNGHQDQRRPSLETTSPTSTTSSTSTTTPSGISIHLNRTESQVARFNSARAMFERLEEKVLVQTSAKTSGSVSPCRRTFVVGSRYPGSRSPSPTVNAVQSVCSSPKRGSPLSPREKSRSEDNIVGGRESSAVSKTPKILNAAPKSNQTAACNFARPASASSGGASSHVNGRGGGGGSVAAVAAAQGQQKQHNNLDFDDLLSSCSGAGEAIVSPGPLSPHLVKYLSEQDDSLIAMPKCVAVEEKIAPPPTTTTTTFGAGSRFGSSKPSPLSPKPTAAELIYAKSTTANATSKRQCPKREELGGGGDARRSSRHQQQTASSSSADVTSTAVTPELPSGHIPAGAQLIVDDGDDDDDDERPILIGVVEKKPLKSPATGGPIQQSATFRSTRDDDVNGSMCNGRSTSAASSANHDDITDVASSFLAAATTTTHPQTPHSVVPSPSAPNYISSSSHGVRETQVRQPLPPPLLPRSPSRAVVEPDDDDDDDDNVAEATNRQLLRQVQGAFNRGSTSESGSQILVLSTSGPSPSMPPPLTPPPLQAVDRDADVNNSVLPIKLATAAATSNGSTPPNPRTDDDASASMLPARPSPTVVADPVHQMATDELPTGNSRLSSQFSPSNDATTIGQSMSGSLDADDGDTYVDDFGFATQGTSPLSPKIDGVQLSLKGGVTHCGEPPSVGRSRGSVQHSFLTGADVSPTSLPELMTAEGANRLLTSNYDDNVNGKGVDDPSILSSVTSPTLPSDNWFDERQEEEEDRRQELLLLLPVSTTIDVGSTAPAVIAESKCVDETPSETDSSARCQRLAEYEEDGVHIFEDGHFWLEIPGLLDGDDNDEVIQSYGGAIVTPKKRDRVKFSTEPIRVYSTFSVTDYDRRNDDVDPVSASAEYELEKRVEKMDVFPVELLKGSEGLGLSIIGMGVGADAGLEKLGIFVKTITDGGAAYKDGRIDVNDQIIEVDGKSLVGVTQTYAASVLRNTSGLVRFLIGREKDGENSEVAQLISQSLQADREREYRRKNYEQELSQQRQNSDGVGRNDVAGYPGLTLPIPSLSVQPSAGAMPVRMMLNPRVTVQEDSTPEEGEDEPTCEVYDLEASSESPSPSPDSSDARIKLKEVTILERLQCEREEYESRIRMLTVRLAEVERIVDGAKDEVAKYQSMLEESQDQYMVIEKKYCKAKKLIKECQQREQDLLTREDYHIQQMQEKDQEYNALVKSLKDRVIQLEQELMETQRAAGLPVRLPYDNTSIKQLQLTPQLLRRPPADDQRKRSSSSSLFDTDTSDSELADSSSNQFDISPDSDDMETKTSTVERKPAIAKDGGQDVFEKAVPQHELLDSTAAKTKAELASKLGSLANRQPPSLKKTSSSGSSGDGPPFDSRDSDSNDTSLGSSREDLESATEPEMLSPTSPVLFPAPTPPLYSPFDGAITTTTTTIGPSALPAPISHDDESADGRRPDESKSKSPFSEATNVSAPAPAATASPRGSPVRIDGKFAEEIRIILERKSFEAKRQAASELEPSSIRSAGHGHLPSDVPRNMTPSPMSTVSSLDSCSSGGGGGNTTGGCDAPSAAVLSVVRHSSDPSRPPGHPSVRDVSRADNADNADGDRHRPCPPLTCCCACLPGTSLLHITEFTMTERTASSATDHPDEQIERGGHEYIVVGGGGGGGGRGLAQAPSIIGDHVGVTSSGNAADRRPHQWHSCSVSEWSSGQVGQWLLALSMEQYISVFMDNNVGGQELLNMDGAKLKAMGVTNGNDRSVLKRRIKDLKALVDKERKAVEKELRAKEKHQRKAERAAEKAVKLRK